MNLLFWLPAAVLLLAGCVSQPSALVPGQDPTPGPTVEQPTAKATTSIRPTDMPPPTLTPPGVETAVSQPALTPTVLSPATPVPAAEPLTFAVIGDYGLAGQGTADVAALIDQRDPDLVLTVGDNNYPDGEAWGFEQNVYQYYSRFIDDGRFFPSLGNHDMTTDNGQPYLDYFELPGNERYYDFVQGDIHFFALNSDWREPDGIGSNSAQARWLQERLAASTAPWQVVFMHVPPYVSMVGKEVPALRWPFAQWGADLVLSGHAHLYERQIVDGLTYVVNGLGGTTIYNFDFLIDGGSQARFNDDFGALFLQGTAEQLSGEFVTRGGVVVDSFVID